VERPVHSRSLTLSDWTGSFTECTPAPHLRDWTGSFAEHTYKVLITLKAVEQLQLHYDPYPKLEPVLLPRCLLPVHRPLPPVPCPHPGTGQDPLLPQYPVLCDHIRRFPLRHRRTVQVTFRLFQAFTRRKANPEGVRTQTGANFESMATFQAFAGFYCIFPFVQIHFHAFMQMRQQQYTQSYPAWYTQGSVASKAVRGSCLQAKLKYWPVSEAQAWPAVHFWPMWKL